MDILNGTDLLEVFKTLSISTGIVSDLTINAWFDTDCQDTLELLCWLCKLGRENVLSPFENEEYKQLLHNKALLSGKEYENAVAQLEAEHPGILDFEGNLLEAESLEEELSMLQDERCDLEKMINIQSLASKQLSGKIQRNSEKEIITTVKRKNVQEKCLELSCKLDEAHEKLQKQINHYAGHLNEFEHVSSPVFLSHIPTFKYDQIYNAVTSHLDLALTKECCMPPKLDITANVVKNKQESSFLTESSLDDLEFLRQRICMSVQNYYLKLVEEKQLKAELNFLQNVNVEEFIMMNNTDESFQMTLEANAFANEKLHELVLADLENLAQQISNSFVDKPRVDLMQHLANVSRQKSQNLTELNLRVTSVLAKHILLHLLLKKEKADVQITDRFFKEVYQYIANNVLSCQTRTDAMSKVISEYEVYKTLPVEKKYKLVDVITKLLTTENNEDVAIDVIRNFDRELHNVEQKIFEDFKDHRQFTKKIEQEKEVLKKFLMSGPTCQVTPIPLPLISNFRKLDQLIETQYTSIKSAMQILNDAGKELSSNKWLKTKRQLWMWFILEPRKVINAIEQIEQTVKQKRVGAF